MARHNNTGKQGEIMGAAYFIEKGFEILHRNWRHRNWEVDIIASRNGLLHFIEVKTRTTTKYGYPEESVDKKKIRDLINASEEFLYRNPQWHRIQFDVLSINIYNEGSC